MELTTLIVWIAYFIGLYFSVFWLLVFLDKGAKDVLKKQATEFPFVSVIIPAYNEEGSIAETIKSAVNLDYPKNKIEIIAVNHGSADKTGNIMDSFRRDGVKVLHIGRNPGDRKGAAVNAGLKAARGEFVACLDADSFIEKDALIKMLPYFESKDVGAVLPRMIATGGNGFVKKIQWVEYVVTYLYKKLMGHVDCIHVTPGPFSLYKRKYIDMVGGFDSSNLVEDMDMALKLQRKNLKIIQTYDAVARTVIPENWREFYAQRNRWYKGGLLNVMKHKDMLLNSRYGEFGLMQMPMMIITALLSLVVFTIIYYGQVFKPLFRRIYDWYYTGFPIEMSVRKFFENLMLIDINFDRIFFIYLIIILGIIFVVLAFRISNLKLSEKGYRAPVLFLAFYPLMIFAVWCGVVKDLLTRKKQKW
ncbi:MAG: glycosyltransferase family 2 protein [Nanoarchaeota archaeon]